MKRSQASFLSLSLSLRYGRWKFWSNGIHSQITCVHNEPNMAHRWAILLFKKMQHRLFSLLNSTQLLRKWSWKIFFFFFFDWHYITLRTLFIIKAFSPFYSLQYCICISPFCWAYVSPSQKGAAFSCWWRGSSWMYLPPFFLNRFHEEEEVRRRWRRNAGELITRVSV